MSGKNPGENTGIPSKIVEMSPLFLIMLRSLSLCRKPWEMEFVVPSDKLKPLKPLRNDDNDFFAQPFDI